MTGLLAVLASEDDRDGFWAVALTALARGIAPEHLTFAVGCDASDLFAAERFQPDHFPAGKERFDARFVDLIDDIVVHREPQRFALAYRLLHRTTRQAALPRIASDADVAQAHDLSKAVHRDRHKMKAFVRFRETAGPDGGPHFIAWFEPQNFIVRDVAPFFAARFAGMRWSILTPNACAHWSGETLSFSAGVDKAHAPQGDPLEDGWRTYYASTFNPARLKVKAMTSQMPKKYWSNLPEAQLIAPLIRDAQTRSSDMIAADPVSPVRRAKGRCHQDGAPALQDIDGDSLETCRRCTLWRHATQPVAGVGPASARLMIVGEQPGDQEDLSGVPFTGPAGELLNKALARCGVDRAACYVTNAVKHFKFEPRGKVRLHKSPDRSEIDHCRWWLDRERETIKPRAILALGVSAVRGLTGKTFALNEIRSRPVALDGTSVMVGTVHPAYLLRLTDEGRKRSEWFQFLEDIKLADELANS